MLFSALCIGQRLSSVLQNIWNSKTNSRLLKTILHGTP